jgi:hypothetical protein
MSDQPELLFLEEADQVKEIHHQLVVFGKTMVERMLEAGEILTRVKQGLPRGAWMPWVETHIAELSHRTINRYMRTYQRRNDPLLQDDPVRFIAEISGHIGKLKSPEPNSTNASNLDTESSTEVPIKGKSEEAIPDVIKTPEDEVLSDDTEQNRALTSEMPQARHARTVSHEISPEVAGYLNTLTPTIPLPEKTVDTAKSSQWFVAIKAAQEAIRELERLQQSYQVHLHHVIDFGPVKKILDEAERLPVPNENDDAERI